MAVAGRDEVEARRAVPDEAAVVGGPVQALRLVFAAVGVAFVIELGYTCRCESDVVGFLCLRVAY